LLQGCLALQLSCVHGMVSVMCKRCDYKQMLEDQELDPTPLRAAVLGSVGGESRPLAAAEIMEMVRNRMSINKVTLYRILDLLVSKGLLKRLSAGDRAFRYGMGESRNHPDHPHFVCRECGVMECLRPDLLPGGLKELERKGKRLVQAVEIRFEGVCESCLE
jgi:Fur family ferric uptake transcriptional regulator